VSPVGLQNSGNFQRWKLSMGINGNLRELTGFMGIKWEFSNVRVGSS